MTDNPFSQYVETNPFSQYTSQQFFPDTSVTSAAVPTSGMPSLFPSFAQGLKRPIDAAAQLLARGVEAIAPSIGTPLRQDTERANRQGEIDYAQTRPETVPGSKAAATIGEMVPATVASFAMPGSAAPGLLARATSGAMSGGLAGALQPVDTEANPDFWGQKATQTGLGALSGGAAPMLASGAARMILPQTGQNARTLLDQGVGLTPGQILGGAANRLEQGAQSIPAIGDQILNARFSAVKDFNRAAINQALAPIGETLSKETPLGREAISEMADKITKHYDDLVPQLAVKVDPTFGKEINNLTGLAQFLHPDQRAQFNRTLTQQVLGKFSPNGTMSGEAFKEIESTLGTDARGYLKSMSYDERRLGNAYLELQGQLRDLLMRSNPDRAAELQAANTAYANMLRVQGAAGATGSKEGVFTPAQLLASVRQLDPSLRKSSFARGNALMQDYAEAGKSVMGSTVPDSGTAYRSLEALGILGPTYLASPASAIGLGAAGLGGMGLYSPPGRSAMEMLLARRPAFAGPMSQGVRGSAPLFSAGLPSLLGP